MSGDPNVPAAPSPRTGLPPRTSGSAPPPPPVSYDLKPADGAPPAAAAVPAPSSVSHYRGPTTPMAEMAEDLRFLLSEAVRVGASDLHLTKDMPPIVRLDGYLRPLDYPKLTSDHCSRLNLSLLIPEQKHRFEREWELDYSAEILGIGRFRVNLHKQRNTVEAAYRVVNEVIVPLRRLGLPPVVEDVARKHSGLAVITGPTGSGKTTTLAAIIDQINNERQTMIITVEDPIEYVHVNRRSIIKQREVTTDTLGFVPALRHVLRQDPDVIVIGEMRDLETISTSLVAAETGHMVYTTLHTPDAVQTVDRIIDVFPPHQQEQTRIQLANTLQAVVAQQLLPVPGNRGRVLAAEVLMVNLAVRKLIRQGKTEQLTTIIQTNHELGMITMDASLRHLYLQGLITYEDAITRCRNPESFEKI